MIRRISVWKLIVVVLIAPFLILIVGIAAYRFDNYMFAMEARLYWGSAPFNVQQFREATINKKSTMVSDLMTRKYFIGDNIERVRSEFGPPTGGYYNYETNLTYTVRVDGRTVWEIVFIVNHETAKVQDILIYKRCCGITRKILGAFMRIIDR